MSTWLWRKVTDRQKVLEQLTLDLLSPIHDSSDQFESLLRVWTEGMQSLEPNSCSTKAVLQILMEKVWWPTVQNKKMNCVKQKQLTVRQKKRSAQVKSNDERIRLWAMTETMAMFHIDLDFKLDDTLSFRQWTENVMRNAVQLRKDQDDDGIVHDALLLTHFYEKQLTYSSTMDENYISSIFNQCIQLIKVPYLPLIRSMIGLWNRLLPKCSIERTSLVWESCLTGSYEYGSLILLHELFHYLFALKLKQDSRFISLVQRHLAPTEPNDVRKTCMSLLKRLAGNDNVWNSYCLLYDTLSDAAAHLVQPLLPELVQLIAKEESMSILWPMTESWWSILIHVSMMNENSSVKSMVLEYLLTSKELVPVCAKYPSVLLNGLLHYLDHSSLYSVSEQGSLECPIGTCSTSFITVWVREATVAQVLCPILTAISRHMQWPQAVVHVLQGLLNVLQNEPNFACINESCTQDMLYWLRVNAEEYLGVRDWMRRGWLVIWSRFVQWDAVHDATKLKVLESWCNPIEWSRVSMQSARQLLRLHPDWVKNNVYQVLNGANHIRSVAMALLLFCGDQENDWREMLNPCWEFLNQWLSSAVPCPAGALQRCLTLIGFCNQYLSSALHNISLVPLLVDQPFLWSRLVHRSVRILTSNTLNADDPWSREDIQILCQWIRSCLSFKTLPLGESRDDWLNILFQSWQTHLVQYKDDKSFAIMYQQLNWMECLIVFLREFPRPLSIATNVLGLNVKRPSAQSFLDAPALLRDLKWSDFHAEYDSVKWQLLSILLSFDAHQARLQLDECIEEMSMIVERCNAPMMNAMRFLLPFATATQLEQCLNVAWGLASEQWDAPRPLRKTMEALIQMFFQPALLAQSEMHDLLRDLFRKILVMAQSRRCHVHEMIEKCCRFWRRGTEQAADCLSHFEEEIFLALIQSPRSLSQTECLDNSLEQDSNRFIESDAVLPFHILSLFNHLEKEKFAFIAMNLIHRLLDKSLLPQWTTNGPDSVIFHVSKEHFSKIRAWQSLLVLQPFVSEAEARKVMLKCLRCLDGEAMLSTRYFMELMLARMVSSFPCEMSLIFDWLADPNQRISNATSLISVVLMIEKDSNSLAYTFYERALNVTLPWTVHAQFTIRAYATLTSFKLWQKCCSDSTLVPLIKSNPLLLSLMNYLTLNQDTQKVFHHLNRFFLFKSFDLRKHVTMQYIFSDLPALAQLPEWSRVHCNVFKHLDSVEGHICFGEAADELELAAQSLHLSDVSVDELRGTPMENATAESLDLPTNEKNAFQRKIISATQALMEAELELPLASERKQMPSSQSMNLILVASLVESPANLGGLTRTCEIMGVDCMTMASLHVKSHPAFKGLTVTADQWLPLEQVPVESLPSYLATMKAKGYVLVGIEQTSSSVSLVDFEFPEKCVLVLGKEREGLPAHLIHQLDCCIEIPQFGIIRSLNVHVSGSLVLWEARRQWLLRQK